MVSGGATSPGACGVRLQCLERAGEGGRGVGFWVFFRVSGLLAQTLNSQMRDLEFEEPVKNSASSFASYWFSTF